MDKMGLNEIREKFLSFFESKGCLRLGSFPLVPNNDPSLLLINSGMAPMKKWFTGAETPPKKRVTTCQKCIRTPDIERVGKTARHGTFFEMLGNFSFGDYFKREAITWAWEFLTEVMGFNPDDLWITIYEDDDEARDIWINEVGVKAERVVKMGKEDNFWEHGTGPCGPCSEIHVDRGIEHACGPDCKIGCDCDRFMEVWNLVFTQFDKDENDNYNRLANPNIDTGMGLERLAAVVQGVSNLFEVDTVRNVMAHISKIAGVNYKDNEKTDISLRVITDHVRSTVMMVSDGVIPSNEGRGYVLRRLLRRAARHGKLLNINRPFLYEVADTVIAESASGYPELAEKSEYIKKIIKIEEERFDATIDNGLIVLNDYIKEAKESGKTVITGEQAFRLHDTYGFPIDLTIEISEENGLSVDEEGFRSEMENQRETSRTNRDVGSSWDSDEEISFDDSIVSEFIGYNSLVCDGSVAAIGIGNNVSDKITSGEKGIIVTDKTVFYGEMGGQVGDIGMLCTPSGKAKVVDTKHFGGAIGHIVEVFEGEISVGDKASLSVDKAYRMSVERNHSTTHLLHKALRETLGVHVAQAGSSVNADRLRFDFSHFSALTAEEIACVEAKVNEAILSAMPIVTQELPIDEAKKLGAVSLFGEKYGDVVRVVSMGDYSTEFCGGTHLSNTSEAGLFKLTSETGVAAGVRRIEGVTGAGVLKFIEETDNMIKKTAAIIKANSLSELDVKAEQVINESKELKRKIDMFEEKMAALRTKNMMTSIRHLGKVNVATAQMDGVGVNELKTMGDKMKEKMINGVIVFASVKDDKISFVAMAMPGAVAAGVHCGNLIKSLTEICGGRGGGKPDMAQGGGNDISKLDEAMSRIDDIVGEMIK